jgi:hypothetical protein
MIRFPDHSHSPAPAGCLRLLPFDKDQATVWNGSEVWPQLGVTGKPRSNDLVTQGGSSHEDVHKRVVSEICVDA